MSDRRRSFPIVDRAMAMYSILREDSPKGVDYSTKTMSDGGFRGGSPARWDLICDIGECLYGLSPHERGALNRRWKLWENKWACHVGVLRARVLRKNSHGHGPTEDLLTEIEEHYSNLKAEYALLLDRQEQRAEYRRGCKKMEEMLYEKGIMWVRDDGLVMSRIFQDAVGDELEIAQMMLGMKDS